MTLAEPRAWTPAEPRAWTPERAGSGEPLVIALVNNMPDAAFVDAERQFTRLLQAGAGSRPIDVRLYSVPGGRRCDVVRRRLVDRYQDLEDLYCRPPDAVVVTGSEPRCAELRQEVIWDELAGLCRWAVASTSSVLFSCLAAHAAVLAMAGIERRRLPAKVSGVFPQTVRSGHQLTAGVGPMVCPHSRYNEVPAVALAARGYVVLIESPDAGWTVAARDDGCLTVLVQGHPEYSPTTLLREYRRDVGRFLTGAQDHYPELPKGYLDDEATALLLSFRQEAVAAGADPSLVERFPFEPCAARIATDWHRPMARLFGNWITELRNRKLQHSWRRAG